jgi:hypothetical protein
VSEEWRPNGTPELVNSHDFIDPKLSPTVPYGVYDIINNVGRVSVGTDHDTAAFAVNAIRRWWTTMGRKRHPKAKRLPAPANGTRSSIACSRSSRSIGTASRCEAIARSSN